MVEKLYVIAVAPHTGAWIETFDNVRVCQACPVAPHTGAWIETMLIILFFRRFCVAPHTGAWIETMCASFTLCVST